LDKNRAKRAKRKGKRGGKDKDTKGKNGAQEDVDESEEDVQGASKKAKTDTAGPSFSFKPSAAAVAQADGQAKDDDAGEDQEEPSVQYAQETGIKIVDED